jgi:hypothetical protein
MAHLQPYTQDSRLREYVKSFGQLYIYILYFNCLQTGRWFIELFVELFDYSVKACIDIAAVFLKNTSNETNSNSPFSYGLLSNILSKINRFFFIRDAKFKMNQKQNPSNSKFSTSFFSGETKNKINFYINTEKQ